METILLDGISLRDKLFLDIKSRVEKLKEDGIFPHLVVVQVGDNSASNIYIKHKQKACEKLGINSTKIILDKSISYDDFKKEIIKLNQDDNIHGILIQRPLPKSFNEMNINSLVAPEKDVDGLHPNNNISDQSKQWFPTPCTASGIGELLREYKIKTKGKKVVIIGRSNIVGKPTAQLFKNLGSNVSVLHSETSEDSFNSEILNADIIVTATGSPDLITREMVKLGVVIFDVGIIRNNTEKVRGDLLYKNFIDIASHITPVPGGIGPMTIAMLMENIVKLIEVNKR